MLKIKKYASELTAGGLALLGIYLFWRNNLALSSWMLGLILFLLFIHRSKKDFLIILTGFIFGWSIEPLAVRIGFETYNNPSFLGVPLWLPFLWALVFLLISRLSEFLKNDAKKDI